VPDKKTTEILIVSLIPQNLKRGVLWFKENEKTIKKARLINPWWSKNSYLVGKDMKIKPLELSRIFLDLGYERYSSVRGPGAFIARGGVMEIWPVNYDTSFLLEFTGNYISLIGKREDKKSYAKPKPILSDSVENMSPGSYAVHEDHGIGFFRGIYERKKDEEIKKFLVMEYAAPREDSSPDRLLVPLEQKERLTPYIGFEKPRIHRLGGFLWEKSKKKTREDAEKMAKNLLDVYAKRSLTERSPLTGDESLEENFRRGFPYKETEDQLKAEKEILEDLSGSHPMDRVLCGDVGFGKTEVAMRAAVRVVSSGKQVAVLAPTTVLAAQHEKTFKERLGNIPLEVSMLSRLSPAASGKKTIAALENGEIDCLIGTHRIFSRDIKFKNLGLVIIDEEQRFGVRQKEKIKEIRTEVDVLSLSATPIPRTLQFTLTKLREISLIKSPPPARVPIKTLVLPYSLKTIQEALEFELERNGQIYFLHNRVETMGKAKERLEKILKKIGKKNKRFLGIENLVGVMHGRMGEKEIINAMDRFRRGKTKILMATTIIENGLDISSANTLIVDDAVRLGLAEAHQLRGRIGRGSIQGFAFFLYRAKSLTEKASERLTALQEYAELGSGYALAMRDLEIRGAGNILGREQSGAANRVGLNLYYQILGEAIEMEKEKRTSGLPNHS